MPHKNLDVHSAVSAEILYAISGVLGLYTLNRASWLWRRPGASEKPLTGKQRNVQISWIFQNVK